MTRFRSACLLLSALVLMPCWAAADDWTSPVATTTYSANGRYRVAMVPKPPAGVPNPAAPTRDKGRRAGDRPVLPLARVERLERTGRWQPVWQKRLVNQVAPVSVLLANDASYLVTFDNWHAVGYGDDVVVIYDRRGDVVRKLSLEQLLPPERLRQVPMSVSSRWWGGKHRLAEGDRVLELQVVMPRPDPHSKPKYSAIRVRLADGKLLGSRWTP